MHVGVDADLAREPALGPHIIHHGKQLTLALRLRGDPVAPLVGNVYVARSAGEFPAAFSNDPRHVVLEGRPHEGFTVRGVYCVLGVID